MRAVGFGLLALAVLLILTGRLWYLQIVKGQEYSAWADGNRIRIIPLPSPRGMIFDRNGNVLAGNRFAFTVSAVPGGLGENREVLIERLAPLLGLSEGAIEEILRTSRANYPYEPIRLLRDVGSEAVVALGEHMMDLPGILLEEEWVREYRYNAVAGSTLGYLGAASPEQVAAGYRTTDLVGQAGLEKYYEEYLRGQDGQVLVEVNALSRPIRTIERRDPVPGHNLHLTLDIEFQALAERIMAEHIETMRSTYPDAQAGAVVVLDAKTGAVLVFASIPAYDPNRLIGPERSEYFRLLSSDSAAPFLHRAVRAYPPGSVFKIVTGLAALDTGVLGPNETYNATGYHLYNKRDWSVRSGVAPAGNVDIRMALARSANDFFWEMATRPGMGGASGGIQVLADYARRLGFGAPTGIDFSPEHAGIVPDPEWKRRALQEPWYPAETMDVAIGQGYLTVTPLQIAFAYTAVANRGVAYRPHLVSRIESADGEVVYAVEPEPVTLDIGAAYWEPVVEGLRAVIQDPRGTSYRSLRWPDDTPWGEAATYDPAGKTGSAQRGENEDPHAWFAGFAPASDPEIVVVVYVEAGGSGGATAAPIARRLMDYYFGAADDDPAVLALKGGPPGVDDGGEESGGDAW